MESSRPLNWAQAFVVASVICYLISLTSNAYCMARGASCTGGLMAFIFGGFQLVADPLAGIPWLANPLLIAGWFLILLSPRRAVIPTVGALLCALMFLATPGVMADAGGNPHQVDSFERGYWLWLASCAFGVLGALTAANAPLKLE
jgi:hypothetical protein